MVNNKGFIRTLEAVIAIILVLVFLFYVTPKVPVVVGKVPENVKIAQSFILDKILVEKELRQCVIDTTITPGVSSSNECVFSLNKCPHWNEIENLIKRNLPSGYDYHCEICGDSRQCTSFDVEEKSVYTHTIFVYKGDGNKRVLRLFFWRSG